MLSLPQTYAQLCARVAAAAQQSGRSSDAITIVAVSKTHPIALIEEAYACGMRHFGENRAAEMAEKATVLQLPDIKWHFIGTLQSRQSLPVAQFGHTFHAVDRLKIARRLANQLAQQARTLQLFVEVNVSGEMTKAGFDCSTWEKNGAQRQQLLDAIDQIDALPHVQIAGLMMMAPYGAAEPEARALFARTRKLSDWLASQRPAWQGQLSMGMSDDFEWAIKEGATHIRPGRILFGSRHY